MRKLIFLSLLLFLNQLVSAKNINLIKIGGDLSGTASGSASVNGGNSFNLQSETVNPGFTLGLESLFSGKKNKTNIGLGLTYEIPRNDMSFITAYGLLRANITEISYLVAHLGYNLYFDDLGNTDYTGYIFKQTGDTYYGIGFGYNIGNSSFELLYSVHRGKISNTSLQTGDTINATMDYSKFTLGYAYRLGRLSGE